LTIAVVDAAAVVDLICDLPAAEPYRRHLAMATTVAALAHLDAEVLSALGRLRRAGQLTQEAEHGGTRHLRGQTVAASPPFCFVAGLGADGPHRST
jgi:predicted nucleic acid-binding protein